MFRHLKWFWRFWKERKMAMLAVFILTVISIAVKTAFPIMLKFIIDEMETDFDAPYVVKLVIYFTAFAILHELISKGLPLGRGIMNMIYAATIRNKYFKIFTESNYKFFQKFRTGDLLTRLTDDIDGSWDRIAWYSCSGIMRPIEAILILGFTLSVMFNYSWELTLYSFIPLPFLVLTLAWMEDRMVYYTDRKQKSISACNNVLESCFSGIRVIKTTRSEQDQIDKYLEVLEDRVEKEKDFLRINQLMHFFSMLVNNVGKVIVIFIGSYFAISGKISLGTLILFLIYLERLIEPIWTLSWFYASSKQVFRYVDRLEATEGYTDRPKTGLEHIVNDFNSLEFENVTFQFEDNGKAGKEAIKEVSLSLNKGETLACVGTIGSGKTTLLELISGGLVPTEGKIYLNGKSIADIRDEEIGKIVGYVRQENLLFSESVMDNLMLGNEFSDEEIEKATRVSLIDSEIKKFPKKYKTILGHRGISLSGGQKQRLSLARTLLRKPSLLLMDDVTAALDAATEEKFWKGFRESYPEASCIVVTHRYGTVRHADKVVVLDEGRVVEYGTADELSKDGTVFSKIMMKYKAS